MEYVATAVVREPSEYRLEQVEAALDDLMNRRVNGKAVLVP